MRKIVKTILGCLCVASVILAGGETPEGGICVSWTLSWIGTALLSAWGYKKMEEAK